MKQEERRSRSYACILRSAQQMFGRWGYGRVNMEQISSEYGISKGMLYHYFRSKDDLFLACAKDFFQAICDLLDAEVSACAGEPPAQRMQSFFLHCEAYFRGHGWSRKLYADLILDPPEHLKQQIEDLRRPLIERSQAFLRSIISQVDLYDHVSPEEALSYLSFVGQCFWNMPGKCQMDIEELSWEQFRENTSKMVRFMLFGIAVER